MLYCEQEYDLKQKNFSVLIVEDSEFVNETIKTLLNQTNQFTISQAYNFAQTAELLQEQTFDYIILDLHLPDISGIDLTRAIKALSNAKIIVLTAAIDIDIRENLFREGIVDYLVKNDDYATLIKSIKNTIQTIEKNKHDVILIIETDQEMCKYIQKIIMQRNYHVVTTKSALEALNILQNQKINATVLNIDYNQEESYYFLKQIKLIDEICHIPTLAISSKNDPEIVRNTLKLGASEFIKKPFNIEEFTLKLDLNVEMNRRYTQAMCSAKMLAEYKEAIDTASFVSKTDTKGIITYANEMFCKLSGYSKKELIGKPHNIVRHPDMPASVFKQMWQTIQAKKVWKGIIKNKKKDGSSYYVKSTIKPILDVNGNIVEYIAIRTDVTDLEIYKEILEENLKASNNNLQHLKQYEEAIDKFVAVIKTNTNNTITYVNNNFEKLSGFSRNELLGKNCSILRAKKHIQQGDCQKTITQLQQKQAVSILFENVSKTNQSYWVDTKIYPILDTHQQTIEHLHLMYDVTEIIKIHEELENTQKEIIHTMGEVGESRSQETGNHVKRVAHYSKLLAKLAGLSQNDTELLYSASPMHDIGKVGIPDKILKKPSRLTPEEFAIMKQHTQIGYNILKNSKRPILQAAAIVAYTHHEKWDGSGYPRGLQKEEIPIFGRITAIADVFDALGSDRVYKKAWKLEKIIKLFQEEKAKHFDPNLIDLFIENLDQFLAIKEQFKD